jgi:ribosomal protein S21
VIVVEVKNGDVSTALKMLSRKVYESGLMLEYKDRMHFKNTAEKKKAKKERLRLLSEIRRKNAK